MTDTVFNIAKGRVAYYCTLPGANDAVTIIPLETAGLETDAVLQKKVSFTDVVSGSTNEQTTLGPGGTSGRKSVSTVGAGALTVTVDQSSNRVDCDMPDIVWTAAGGAAISRLVVCYEPDTTLAAGATRDTAAIPMVLLDAVATPSGGDITYTVNAAGFFRAS